MQLHRFRIFELKRIADSFSWILFFHRLNCTILLQVCRALVLICDDCEERLREYHCHHHSYLKDCYYTFLEVYDDNELKSQIRCLEKLETCKIAMRSKHIRKTLRKQIEKINVQLDKISNSSFKPNRHAPRRCRMCSKSRDNCDGNCWGFWK